MSDNLLISGSKSFKFALQNIFMKPLIIVVDCDKNSCEMFFNFLSQLELSFKCFTDVSDYFHLVENEPLLHGPLAIKLSLAYSDESNIAVLKSILAQQKMTTLPFFMVTTEYDSGAQCLSIGNKKYYSTALSYLQLSNLIGKLERNGNSEVHQLLQK